MSDFVHLHVHTQYSLLDGLSNINKLVERVASFNQDAVAITDHGVMYGTVHFFNACKKAGIKPIIGLEAYMSETSHLEKQARMGADQYHLTLWAKNFAGYQNLMKLTSIAHIHGFSYKPRIDMDLLKTYKEGIIASSGCAMSIISKRLKEDKRAEAKTWAQSFLQLFGDDFYMEIQHHPKIEKFDELTRAQIDLANELGIPLVATNDVHYVDADDAEAQDALLAIQTRRTIADTNRLSFLDSPDFYLKDTPSMLEPFAHIPQATVNTRVIADKCEVEIPTGKMIFPNFPIEKGETLSSTLKKMTYERAKNRFETITPEITTRLDYELGVIGDKSYDSYFLIVQDFVNWAKNQGIGVGPGRGSAAGSLVSYCLGITDIDPLEHQLAFERFLNPQRPSPPDIDIDIADVRRDEVIRYTAEKYGEDHVAQVITFGTMEARAAIRDIGRVLGMPYAEPDTIAKLIPPQTKLADALMQVPELQTYYTQAKYKKLIDLAQKVEGCARHHSVHAAAVVIADKPLTNYTPIQIESKGGKTITQYDMYAMDLNIDPTAIGLLKMDFLGLRNLSILGESLLLVKKTQGIDIDLNKIPLDDQKVFKMLSSAETTGIFQLESAGMRRVARNLKPNRFSDIVAMVALYRPGPMELIDEFIAGKQDPKRIKYPHKDLTPVLEETYGIPVYQEQVLQIANVFAGYSLGEADILRRAIGKKKKSILDKEKARFIRGAVEKGYEAKKAEEIWGFIDKFAGYGFNKAHSASYAMIAYRTAYMKANYPVEYMTALLTIESQSHSNNRDEKISQAIEECRRLKIELLPPDINASEIGFTIEANEESLEKKAIRFGLSAIKNVGVAALEAILSTRAEVGHFTSLTHFLAKNDNRRVNKKVLESLINAGAFDQFANRPSILSVLDEVRSKVGKSSAAAASAQSGLFDTLITEDATFADEIPILPDYNQSQKLKLEKELLGVYLSSHPMSEVLDSVKGKYTHAIKNVDAQAQAGQTLTLAGLVTSVRQVTTKKNNQEMAFATLEDQTGSLSMVFFPKTYAQLKSSIQNNVPCIVTGKVESRDGEVSFLVDSLEVIGGSAAPEITLNPNTIMVGRDTSVEVLKKLGQLLKSNPGDDIITIAIPNGGEPKTFTLPYRVSYSSELKKAVTSLLQ
jgi:DNA polymerase-3 subunit alpha